jgi:hypothetical protein
LSAVPRIPLLLEQTSGGTSVQVVSWFGSPHRWVGVSALAGTISAPLIARAGGFDAARWLRSALSFLVAVGILAVALPAAFGSGARGAGVDPIQVFSSGSLLAPDASGGAQLSISGLVPGQSRSATIRLSNPGSAARFSLSSHLTDRLGAGAAPLSSALMLRIESARSGRTVFSGALASMPRLALGEIGAGAQRAYRFTVTLPPSAGNAVEGSSMSAGFAWVAS